MQILYYFNTGKLLPESEIERMTDEKIYLDCHPIEKQLSLRLESKG
jgi:hypothetical protein